MNSLLGQVSYPVFLYMTFHFFLIASVFSFIVGVALALRSKRALHVFDVMNRWVSVRKMMRPLSTPHYVEPALLKRRTILGGAIIVGSMASVFLLEGADLRPTLTLFEGGLTQPEISGVALNLRGFLIVGNIIGMLVGVLILFFPNALAKVENYTDRWLAVRKSMLPLDRMHMEVDCWVLKHPTSVGLALSVFSLSAGMLMLNQLQNLPL